MASSTVGSGTSAARRSRSWTPWCPEMETVEWFGADYDGAVGLLAADPLREVIAALGEVADILDQIARDKFTST